MTVVEAIELRQQIEAEYDDFFQDQLWDWYDISEICPDDFDLICNLCEIIGD